MPACGASACALVWPVGRCAPKRADDERYVTFAQCCDDPFLFAERSSFFRSSSDSFHSHARPPITHSGGHLASAGRRCGGYRIAEETERVSLLPALRTPSNAKKTV